MLAIPKTTIKADTIQDEKIGIVITKDGNTVSINHTSDITIQKAVVEYAFYENDVYISMLDTFDVSNNRLTINKGVTTLAVKVHQVLTLRGNLWYRYATTNQNTAGSFAKVQRMNIVEIETTHIETVDAGFQTSESPNLKKYYNFYFQFDYDHDELISLDVEYILETRALWGLIVNKHNMSKNVKNTDKIKEYVKNPGWINTMPITHWYMGVDTNIPALETNTTNNPGNYVVRLQPHGDDSNLKLHTNATIENFAIIRVKYMIDGEFILSDVINNPTTPIDDQINDLGKTIENIKNILGDFTNFLNTIINFFTSNGSTVLKVIVGVIALILLGPIFTVIKFVFTIIKYIFKIPGQLLNTLKVLFVPGYNKNERKR